MMTPIQQDLWQQLKAFRFDPPDAAVTMADKIAREQGWTITFTERAIDEYRRYLVLAKTAGHGVSPSEVVDIVWHWHLLYTRSYWDQLCGQVLQMRLHHEPSTGTGDDTAKYHDWYDRTLASYRRTFGTDAPEDIWPLPANRDDAAPFARKIDSRKYWLLPRGRSIAAAATAIALLAVAMFAGGCGPVGVVTANPFNLRGTEFLVLFPVFAVAMFIFAGFIRGTGRGEATLPGKLPPLDPYEAAYLNGGGKLAVSSALANLVAAGLVDVSGKNLNRRFSPADQPDHPLERAVLEAVTPGAKLGQITSNVSRELARLEGKLRDLRLVVDPARASGPWLVSLLVALVVPLFGVIKILVGIARNKPVIILVVMTLVATVLALVLFVRRLHRTRGGDQVLKSMREKHYTLKSLHGNEGLMLTSMGVALFGLAALSSAHPLYDLRQTIGPEMSSSSDGGGGCGSGCSGGDGGGCGGGCGGCGGD